MMLTIHGLPLSAKYHDLKTLIKERCNITDFILDNLVSEEGNSKKVRIGLANESEGSYLMERLHGFRVMGNMLRVLPVGKPSQGPGDQPQNFDNGGYPPRNNYPNSGPGPNYGNRPMEPMGRPDIGHVQGRPDIGHVQGRPDIGHGPGRLEPWGSGNQWGPNQPGPNQMGPPMQQTNYNNYQQPHPGNAPYGQQGPPQGQRPFEQRDRFDGGMPPQNQGYDGPDRGGARRSHVLRSVEIIDEPMNRNIAQPQRYMGPGPGPEPQKPLTIMKDNFQGPQYNADRPSTYQGPHLSGQMHPGAPGQSGPLVQPSSWNQNGSSTEKEEKTSDPPASTVNDKDEPTKRHRQRRHRTRHRNSAKLNILFESMVAAGKLPFAKPSPPFERKYPEPMGPNKGSGPGSGPRFSPRDIPVDPHGRRMPSPGRRMPSPGRQMPSPGRRMPSPGRRMPSPGRRVPSPGRRMPSPGRRMPSPGRRMPSPGRRMPSPGRRMPSPGRRVSSPGRRVPSPGRRMPSPGRRMPSPGRRMPSPGPGRRMPSPDRRRRASPLRRPTSPGHKRPGSPGRYSPPRRVHDKPGPDKYSGPEDRPPKDIRPAYDAPRQASNQGTYSGGYRPNLHENVQYPIPGMRQPEQRNSSWQDGDKTMFSAGMKKDDDRRDVRMPKFEPRIDPLVEPKARSPRRSRSPMRRDRSPLRDRFKKHSPSPRSPRRSWALEKQRSPEISEAPPPPVWPGQTRDELRRLPDQMETDKLKRTPVWEPRRPEDERRFDAVRRSDTSGREPSGFKPDDRFPPRETKFESREPKFEPREPKFDPREPKFEPRGPRESRFEPRDPKFAPREPKFEPRETKFESRQPKFEPREEFRRTDDVPKRFERELRDQPRHDDMRQQPRHDLRREEFSREGFRREERKIPNVPDEFNKEFEDVYKRALELNKRAEELRKREDRRREDVDLGRGEHSRDAKDTDRKFGRHEDRHRDRDRDRGDFKQVEPEWVTDRNEIKNLDIKAKKEKATNEIASKIIEKHGRHFTGDMKDRIMEEMKLVVSKAIFNMFGHGDVSFIEMVVKFNAKYDEIAELRMYNDVLSSLPSYFRKRAANEPVNADVPAKGARRSTDKEIRRVPEWKPNMPSSGMQVMLPAPAVHIPNPGLMSHFDMMQHMSVQQPIMVPAPTYASVYEEPKREPEPQSDFQETQTYFKETSKFEGFNLYLCKDDFEPFSDAQAEYLKKFLVSQLIHASQTSQGWSPDFTLKGLQSLFRYEVVTRDEATRDWLLQLDFSNFDLFNVLVYTKEELWYERAAVWLPGHSRHRTIEPLVKLQLQNGRVEGLNIGKWKLVKKIVTTKGTRIYVDMPPSSARALEKHKMMLSYELQKVSVFLKAVAVDKEAFDAGLREVSVGDPAEIVAAVQNSPMPSLTHDPNIIKICLKGLKTLSLAQARKIKEMIIYHIFKYHKDYGRGSGRTDFVKYGYCMPGYFGVVAENAESKRWLMGLDIGKLKRHAVIVLGADDANTKTIRMSVFLKKETNMIAAFVFEKIKLSNQGVKGLNFNLWKPHKVSNLRKPSRDRTRDRTRSDQLYGAVLDVDIDLESVETIIKMKYKLDYADKTGVESIAMVRYEQSNERLENVIKRLKAELNDSYDVANMDIASSDEDDDDDIVYMGEVKAH